MTTKLNTNPLIVLSEGTKDEPGGKRLDPDEDVGLGHVADDAGNASPVGNFLQRVHERGFKDATQKWQ